MAECQVLKPRAETVSGCGRTQAKIVSLRLLMKSVSRSNSPFNPLKSSQFPTFKRKKKYNGKKYDVTLGSKQSENDEKQTLPPLISWSRSGFSSQRTSPKNRQWDFPKSYTT